MLRYKVGTRFAIGFGLILVFLLVLIGMASADISSMNTLLAQIAASNLTDATAQQALKRDVTHVGEIAASMRFSLIVGGSVAALFAIAIGIVIYRSVVLPLRALDAALSHTTEQNDLTQRVESQGQDELAHSARAFNALMQRFGERISKIRAASSAIASSADQQSTSMANIADMSCQQSDAATAMAAAIEQLSTNVTSMSDVAIRVQSVAAESLDCADEGNEKLSALMGGIAAAESTMDEISSVVADFISSTETIATMTAQVKEVADQTNLLALNAAIEAARAGEQGRGFAVVADEVRKLAEKSSASAAQIDNVTRRIGQQSALVAEVLDKGRDALTMSMDAMETVVESVSGIKSSAQRTSQGAADIAGAIQEQKVASSNIAQSIEQIAQMSEKSSASIRQSAQAATHLQQLARELDSAVSAFKT